MEWNKYQKKLELTIEIKAITLSSTFKRQREPLFSADIKDITDSTLNSP
jgi:hypothetical protein